MPTTKHWTTEPDGHLNIKVGGERGGRKVESGSQPGSLRGSTC